MDSHSDVGCKLVHLCNFWANLGLQHPTEKSAKDIAALAALRARACNCWPHGCALYEDTQKASEGVCSQLEGREHVFPGP